ncbi:MAG: hypothetical protein AB7G17_11060 [Phycisphaerales bacterium]
MSTRDLFELAALDVLGLLDDEERRDFENAFRAATPAVQAQVRREQLRVADLDEWLPRVDAPAGLKTRVLSEVRAAIAAVRAGHARDHVSNRLSPLAAALQRNVSPLWRAATVGFAASLVLVGVFFYRTLDQFNTVTRSLESENAVNDLVSAGAGVTDAILSPVASFVSFHPVSDQAVSARARLIINPATKSAQLICDLPSLKDGYRLVAVSDDGSRIEENITLFNLPAGRQAISLASASLVGRKLAILPVAAGENLAAAILVSWS